MHLVWSANYTESVHKQLCGIRFMASTEKLSPSSRWIENSLIVWNAKPLKGMFTENMGTWCLAEEALWLKIQMKWSTCRLLMEAVKDASPPLQDDTNAACLLVSVVKRSPSPSESVQQRQMLMHSCEPETPGFHVHAAALWIHQEEMGGQLRWLKNTEQKKTTCGLRVIICENTFSKPVFLNLVDLRPLQTEQFALVR